jgi:TRAP-type C4-dicarboxylate transport system permease small subunit
MTARGTAQQDRPSPPVAVDSRHFAIDRALEPLRWCFRWGSLAMLVVMVALPFVQVVMRELFSRPIVGVEELARFMLICTVFLALPYIVSAGSNIRMEEFQARLPPGFVRFVKLAIAVAAIVAFAAAAVTSVIAIQKNLNNATPTLGIPYWIFLGAAAIGFGMTTIECAVQFVKALQNRPLYVTFPQEHEPQELLDLPVGNRD